jgi:hypothetical protein
MDTGTGAAPSIQRYEPDEACRRLAPNELRDLLTVAELRESLSKLAPEGVSSRKFDRKNIVPILKVIGAAVGAIMNTEIATEESTVIFVHTTSQLLTELAEALGDLDRGLVDAWPRPENNGGSRQYNTRERATISFCLETVSIYQSMKRTTLAEAEKQVSVFVERMGIKIRGKRVTAKNLNSWRRHPPGSR